MAISLLSIFNASRVIAVFVSSDAILLGKVAVDESQPVSRGRLPANRRRPRRTRKNSGQIGQACANSQRDFAASVAAIQKRIGGRVGVYVLDTQSQLELAFKCARALCDVLHVQVAARCTRAAQSGCRHAHARPQIALRSADMLPHAPVTSVHLAEGSITVGDLCAAIVTVSDNPAANILLAATGGPSALTQFLGGIGAVLEQAQAVIGGLVAAAIARQ